ncbi:glycosyltransferase family 4 protein [Thioalkalivibrio sp. ALE11]|uniref:glycosyltransferase family 4 protein n=1 Tax=Thioalkalivibrio sp. ALE11 TaxID=1265494 RepID=UPI00039FB393|nr:glycosyltransferase family 4 protein [Thioalkalivibrio sp. ALE11]
MYAYRYGIVGGVSTQLLLRQAALARAGGAAAVFFSQDNGLRAVVPPGAEVYFGADVSLRRLVRRVRPEAVVVDSPELLGPARGGGFRRPAVFLDVHTTTPRGLAYLDGLRMNGIRGVMVPTRYSAELVCSRVPGAPVSVVPNVLNTEVFTPGVPGSESGPREFIWVGKLDRHKNWRLALVYTRLLMDLFGDVEMSVVGGYGASDTRAAEFFDLAHRLGISGSVRWLDRVDNSALAGLYRRCATSGGAMLVTSRDESFGMAAAEALLCGCPLLANDLSVFREVFPASELIQRVDIWNPDAVAKAAGALETPPSAEAIEALGKDLRWRYGPEAFLEQFTRVVRSG